MAKFNITSDYDGNEAFEVEAENVESAALEALGVLGWNVSKQKSNDA